MFTIFRSTKDTKKTFVFLFCGKHCIQLKIFRVSYVTQLELPDTIAVKSNLQLTKNRRCGFYPATWKNYPTSTVQTSFKNPKYCGILASAHMYWTLNHIIKQIWEPSCWLLKWNRLGRLFYALPYKKKIFRYIGKLSSYWPMIFHTN